MFSKKTKDSGDTYIAEIRSNFVPTEVSVVRRSLNSDQPQQTERLNMSWHLNVH